MFRRVRLWLSRPHRPELPALLSLLDFMTDSAQPEPQTPQPDPRFLALVKQEHERLSNVYPTAEDVPGCVSLLDSFLLCNGAS
jgi:hypothetical protein